jgi:hypothetical protein
VYLCVCVSFLWAWRISCGGGDSCLRWRVRCAARWAAAAPGACWCTFRSCAAPGPRTAPPLPRHNTHTRNLYTTATRSTDRSIDYDLLLYQYIGMMNDLNQFEDTKIFLHGKTHVINQILLLYKIKNISKFYIVDQCCKLEFIT